MSITFSIIILSNTSVANTATIEPGPSIILGGRIWTDTGYQLISKELTTKKKQSSLKTFIQISSHSSIHTLWQSPDKKVGGLFDLNVSSKIGDNESSRLRYAYGWWKLANNCRLIFGQSDGWLASSVYLPGTTLGVTQSYKSGLINFGTIYAGRAPQVRLEWTSSNFSFSIAAVQPTAEQITKINNLEEKDISITKPRIDFAADFKFGNFMSTPAFGWSHINYAELDSKLLEGYTSWIFILPIKYSVGPLTFKFQVHCGLNPENEYSGELHDNMFDTPKAIGLYSLSINSVINTSTISSAIALEYRTGGMMITAGYGSSLVGNNLWKTEKHLFEYSIRKSYFVAIPFQVHKNFTVSPEIQYYTYGVNPKTGEQMGNEWLIGMQFKFLF